MNNENSKRYSRVAKLIGILSGFILVLGTSYAVFRVTITGEKENVVSAGKLDVRVENEQNEIAINNALPQTEEEGKQNTPYTFDIVNRGNINAMYDLYLEVNNESTLDARVIRYYLTVVEDGEEKQITPVGNLITNEEENRKEGKKAYKIDTKYLDVNKTNNYKLYLWLDYDTEAEQAINKTFKANVRVDAEQIYKGNKLIKQVDVSENNDGSVTAYMYGNDTVVIKGQGQVKSGLSDSLVFANEEVLPNYKKVLQSMGVDVSNINTLDDLQKYIDSQDSNFNNQLDEQVFYICEKEVLKEMNKDSDKVTDYASLESYLRELGWINEEGNPTDVGDEFLVKSENKYNKNYSLEGYSPSKIVLEEGITNIPKGLFDGNNYITEVKIPNSVTSIGDNAFYNCFSLTSITIPNGVTRIGKWAFASCSNLTSITLPNSVTWINDNAFSYCSNLTSITIPNSVRSIFRSAFEGCKNLTSITIPNSVTSIDDKAFYNCFSLNSITIPDSVTRIGDSVFSNCASLKSINVDANNPNYISEDGILYNKNKTTLIMAPGGKSNVTIPSSVTSIGASAFYNCRNLTSITIPNSVTSIDVGTFYGCSNLNAITIPNSVTSIGASAFSYCSNLTSITIPDGVTRIGVGAFSYCSNLTSITLPKKLTSDFNSNWFTNCSSLKKVDIANDAINFSTYDGALYNKEQSKLLFVPVGKVSIELSNKLNTIGSYSFSNCRNLTSITISSSVTNIGDNAFFNCTSMKSINVDVKNPDYSSEDGVLYNKNKTTLIVAPGGKSNVTIPNSVTSIGDNAFYGCGITSITIPNSVTSIGSRAFYNCSNLTTINIDNTKAYVDANWDAEWMFRCDAKVNYLRQ